MTDKSREAQARRSSGSGRTVARGRSTPWPEAETMSPETSGLHQHSLSQNGYGKSRLNAKTQPQLTGTRINLKMWYSLRPTTFLIFSFISACTRETGSTPDPTHNREVYGPPKPSNRLFSADAESIQLPPCPANALHLVFRTADGSVGEAPPQYPCMFASNAKQHCRIRT